MSSRQLLFIQGGVAALVGVLHIVGLEYFLYWKFWWIDIVLHTLGGTWVALAALWGAGTMRWRVSVGAVLLAVVAVGVAWELWEVWLGMEREENYAFDTLLDLIMDVCGGCLGILIARSARLGIGGIPQEEDRVVVQ